MGKLRRHIQRFFPERQIFLRTEGRVRYVRLPQAVQLSVFGVLVLCAGWVVFASGMFFVNSWVIEAKDARIGHQRLAHKALVQELTTYQTKIAEVAQKLRTQQSNLLGVFEQGALGRGTGVELPGHENDGARSSMVARAPLERQLAKLDQELRAMTDMSVILEENLGAMKSRLEQTMAERDQTARQRTELERRLQELHEQLLDESGKSALLQRNLKEVTIQLDDVTTDRDKITEEREWLYSRVEAVESEQKDIAATQQRALGRLTEKVAQRIRRAEELLDLTGVDREKVLARAGVVPIGQGGPYLAAGPIDQSIGTLAPNTASLDLHVDRMEGLQRLLKRIPLVAPVDSYYVSSRYGFRIDPLTKKRAMHRGVDLAGVHRSPVYSAGPGVVTSAGSNGLFGLMVEIDHGMGIRTRYGHLSKILVRKDQEVSYRDKIGLMGSTGRSTGPHVHYETWINDRPHDPMKLIKAGRYMIQNKPEIEYATPKHPLKLKPKIKSRS